MQRSAACRGELSAIVDFCGLFGYSEIVKMINRFIKKKKGELTMSVKWGFVALALFVSLGVVTAGLAAASASQPTFISSDVDQPAALAEPQTATQKFLLAGEETGARGYRTPSAALWRSTAGLESLGDWDSRSVNFPRVISETGQYRMWYQGNSPTGGYAIGLAESPDGLDWTKFAGNPVIQPGASGAWDDFYRGQPTIFKDGGVYKMWYSGAQQGGAWQTGYATSTNGVDWNFFSGNPVLSAGPIGSWDEIEADAPSVILDGGLYKMWYHGCTPDYSSCSIGYATSPDGVNWTKYAGNPVVSGTVGSDEASVLWPSVVKNGSTYLMWYYRNDDDWNYTGIGLATSSDGVVWTKYSGNPVLMEGWDGGAVVGHFVMLEGSTYKMWLRSGQGESSGIGFATSADGIDWTMYAGNPLLRPGSAGLIVYANYAHDWLIARTSPNMPITLTVADGSGVPEASVAGMTDEQGEFRSWEWGWDPWVADISVGDIVTAWTAAFSTTINPIGAIDGVFDVDADTVSGTIHAPWFVTLTVHCEVWVENGPAPIEVSGVAADGGSYSCDFGAEGWDITAGQQVGVMYEEPDGDWVINVFEPPWMRVNYAHNWVGANYPAGHDFWITITNELGDFKAVAQIASQPNNGWGGEGFQTEWYHWTPEQPDIQPGDWAYFRADDGYANDVRVGVITGVVEAASDSVSGSIYTDWFSGNLRIECHPWGAPGGAPGKESTAGVDGDPPYLCQWDPLTEWDVQPGQDIAVMYVEPDNDRVINVFREPDYTLHLYVNYGHDWVEGRYEAGHTVWITLTDGGGAVKATATGVTDLIPWWGGDTGFSTDYNLNWDGDRPDIQAGDWLYGRVDNGYSAQLHLGDISGTIDVDNDSISGPIVVGWLTQTLNVGCHTWGAPGPAPYKSSTAEPDGSVPYFCQWDPVTEWDVLPGEDIGVSYDTPDGHMVFNVFRQPPPHLWINTDGWGSPGEGGNYVLRVAYKNDGEAAAEGVVITATLEGGMTYLGDTSGLPVSGSGAPGDPLVWQVGDLPVNLTSYSQFDIFVNITAAAGDTITHTVQIENGSPYSQGDWWLKESRWSGMVLPNDTQIAVYKGAWVDDPVPGYDYVYSLNACNNGSTGSTEVLVSDTLPLSTTLVNWWSQSAGWGVVYSDPQSIALGTPSLPSWRCSEIYLRVTLDANAWPGMTITNTAFITASNDLSPDDNRSTIVHGVGQPHYDLAISKGWRSGQLAPGGQLYYEVDYRNHSNLPVDNVLITSTLPLSATFAAAWYDDEYGHHDLTPALISPQGYVVWNLGTLLGGEGRRFTISCLIDSQAPPGLVLKHTVQILTLPLEDDFDNNQIIWMDTINPAGPNLRLETYYDWWGDGMLSYEIRALNMGTEYIGPLLITDTLPLSTTFDGDWQIGHGPWVKYTYDAVNGLLVLYLDGLYPFETASSSFRAHLLPTIVGNEGLVFTNRAEGMTPGDVYLPDDYTEITAFTGPDLYIEKALLGGHLLPGELVTFTLSFGNAQHPSGWPWQLESNAWLTDTLPAELEFVSSELLYCGFANWCEITPSSAEAGQLVWQLWPLAPGDHNTIRVTARITDSVNGLDVLLNTAEIAPEIPANDREFNDANNSDSLEMPIDLPYFEIGKVYAGNRVAGTQVTYTLTITNTGNGQGDNLQVIDWVPDWFTYGGGGDAYSAGRVDWFLTKIASGGLDTVWFTGTLSCSAGGVVNNQYYQVAASDQGVVSAYGAPLSFVIQPPALEVTALASASTILPGGTVTFTATAATNGTPFTYAWTIGSTVIASGPTASHTFDTPGTYQVVVTVTDGCSFTDSYTLTVVVSNHRLYLPVVRR